MKKISLLFIILAGFALVACSDSASDSDVAEGTIRELDLTLNLKPDTWIYVSLETGIVVAEIPFADNEALAQMDQRTDWDIAYAPDGLMRTNAQGQVAIGQSNTDFANIDILEPFSGLTVGEKEYEVW